MIMVTKMIDFLLLTLLTSEKWCSFALSMDTNSTTDHPEDVCELDNSCKSTSDPVNEVTTTKPKLEKWKYNVSDETSLGNDSITNMIYLNETNGTVSLDINVTKTTYNKSTVLVNSTATKAANVKYQIQFEDKCACDTTIGSCNINCCCDRDCVSVDRNVFESCNNNSYSEEDQKCRSRILNSPLLCIVKDNLYSKHFYPQYKVAEHSNVEKLLRNREVYGWSLITSSMQTNEEYEFPDEFQKYQIHSFVYTLNNDFEIQLFRLPKSTVVSRICEHLEPVTFLDDYQTTCTHRIKNDTRTECENVDSIFNSRKYYANFSLITDPSLINLTSISDYSYNTVNVFPFVCDDITNLLLCKSVNTTKLPQLSGDHVCSGAVTGVHYKFIHNGTEGIVAAQVYLHLEDLPLKPNLLWAIKFKLTYEWSNQNESYELSGYPGYVFGKPILSGFKKSVASHGSNKTRSVITMSPHRAHWLTTFSTDSRNNRCLTTRRENLLFQENLFARCFLSIHEVESVKQCEALQNKIFALIFGPHVNISNTYLSAFGTPNVADSSTWIPLSSNLRINVVNESSCSGIINSVKVVILHAAVGEFANPQHMIIASKATGVPFEYNLRAYSIIPIVLAVNFYDVTKPPLRVFAEPPTYEIKLPTDFFYPFFSGTSNVHPRRVFLIISYFAYLSLQYYSFS